MLTIYAIRLITALVVVVVVVAKADQPQANLTSGLWTGSTLRIDDLDKHVEVFLGVRYAKAPVGDLRFQPPQPAEYGGTVSATQRGPACIQRDTFIIRQNMTFSFSPAAEDCLHLNVYRPVGARNAPIIVHYFGGSFYGGYNGMFFYDPERLVARHNVIVVTVNYRPGIMGFLYMNSTQATGNAGLLDMLLAAKFVKANAEQLGGDPDRITGWGQSSGGIGLGMLMSSPLSKGLFRSLILQSGTVASSATPLGMNSLANGVLAASLLGCHNGSRSTEEQLDELAMCMKALDARDLYDQLSQSAGEQLLIQFQPIAGVDELIPTFPFPADKSSMYIDPGLKSVLMTTVSNEGAMFAISSVERYDYDTSTVDGLIEIAWAALRLVLEIPQRVARAAINTYFSGDRADRAEGLRAMSALFGDLFFECPADLHSDTLATSAVSVYRLLWDHRPATSYWPDWVGATHYDDVPFTSGSQFDLGRKAESSGFASSDMTKFLRLSNRDEDKQMIEQTMKLIGDFAHFGTPSVPSSTESWPLYSATERATVRVKDGRSTIFHGPKANNCHVWEDFLTNNLVKPVFGTTPATRDNEVTVAPRGKDKTSSRKTQRRAGMDVSAATSVKWSHAGRYLQQMLPILTVFLLHLA